MFCREFMKRGGDVEAQNGQLYPNQMETPQLRWAFIRKVYSIICFQLALTAAVAIVVVTIEDIPRFFRTMPGFGTLIAIIILTIAILISLWWLHNKHPWNYVLLVLFTIFEAITIGLCCSYRNGKIVMLALILTATVVIGLTAYTFWAVKRGADFNFLGPFLFAAGLMLFTFAIIQFIIPMGPFWKCALAALSAILACAYIVYDTDNIIKRLSYDEYILGAVSIYTDIVMLFVSLLRLLG
ncbi:protein LIFEGUARD 2-like [Argentina anserina]|uniref:protein LIFEGUARD 2-like n=1 Tax=Argentina anserina TaxID=57926 RepID=UPI0021764939|nr:protein LIFEGUARD 2-like [Potentilla anserina]